MNEIVQVFIDVLNDCKIDEDIKKIISILNEINVSQNDIHDYFASKNIKRSKKTQNKQIFKCEKIPKNIIIQKNNPDLNTSNENNYNFYNEQNSNLNQSDTYKSTEYYPHIIHNKYINTNEAIFNNKWEDFINPYDDYEQTPIDEISSRVQKDYNNEHYKQLLDRFYNDNINKDSFKTKNLEFIVFMVNYRMNFTKEKCSNKDKNDVILNEINKFSKHNSIEVNNHEVFFNHINIINNINNKLFNNNFQIDNAESIDLLFGISRFNFENNTEVNNNISNIKFNEIVANSSNNSNQKESPSVLSQYESNQTETKEVKPICNYFK